MASVSSASSSAADVFAAINGTKSSTAKSTTADLEDRFLTLLTTQLRNQDPLNPLDNAQVTTQLAQINTVNGVEKLNATLNQLLAGYNNAQAMEAAGMIGKAVLVNSNVLTLSEGAAAGAFRLDSAADAVTVKVYDKSGALVSTESLGAKEAGDFTFNWDGKNDAGTVLKDGNYTFQVSATKGGKAVTTTALQVGTVNAVVRTGSSFVLDLGSLGDYAFSDVQQIY